MKKYILLMGLLSVAVLTFGENKEVCKIRVYAFEIIESEKVEKFKEFKDKNGLYFEADELQNMISHASNFEYVDLEFTNNVSLVVDDEYFAQYLSKESDEYLLKRSKFRIGMSCDITISPMQPGGYSIEGNMSYFAVSERKRIEVLSKIDAGEPISVMGGKFGNGILLPPKKIARVIASAEKVSGEDHRITGLFVAIDRDVSLEDASAVRRIVF